MQGVLEEALGRAVGQDVATVGAGRTDRGVHALGQVLHVDVAPRGRAERFLSDLAGARRRLDRLVGPAITVWSIVPADEAFHARFSASERAYAYTVVDTPAIDPLERHRCWHVEGGLAVDAMRCAAPTLLGEHDFASLCRRADGGHTVRRLDAIEVERLGAGRVTVRLRGPAFCHQLVRSVVGCLVAVGRGERPPEWLGDVLAARDRATAAAVAPAHGLVLVQVRYGDVYPPSPLCTATRRA